MDSKRLEYNDYVYPIWATILGWMFTLSSVTAIPVVALIWYINKYREKRNMNINCVDLKEISGKSDLKFKFRQ
jgi:hypothetical protein